jgi:hypothetical protein
LSLINGYVSNSSGIINNPQQNKRRLTGAANPVLSKAFSFAVGFPVVFFADSIGVDGVETTPPLSEP